MKTVLQIVPKPPRLVDGVGDYALTLARKLRDSYGLQTIFAAPQSGSTASGSDFQVMPLDRLADNELGCTEHDLVILHYVNYGYQKRGVPFRLLSIFRAIRRNRRACLLTILHELSASGPPWKSAFWLRPIQIHIARSVARISDVSIVSSEALWAQVKHLVPNARVSVHPVPSNFGEPRMSSNQIASRDSHRWAICGGTALVERSLQSFRGIVNRIPDSFFPLSLFVLGGNESPVTRSLLADLVIESEYRPRIAIADASQILSTCSFAWFDYFRGPNVQTSVILKSSAFAAACAHGVIPIFPRRSSAISLGGDRLPGPFFIESNLCELPEAQDRVAIATQFYCWYQQHASSECLVRGVADALGLSAAVN